MQNVYEVLKVFTVKSYFLLLFSGLPFRQDALFLVHLVSFFHLNCCFLLRHSYRIYLRLGNGRFFLPFHYCPAFCFFVVDCRMKREKVKGLSFMTIIFLSKHVFVRVMNSRIPSHSILSRDVSETAQNDVAQQMSHPTP